MEQFKKRALEYDKNDALSSYVDEFVNDKDLIYLDGNSLGKLPKRTKELQKDIIDNQWGNRLIRSWNEHWMELPPRIAGKIAQLLGVHEDEIFVGDSTSLNLYKLIYATLEYQSGKHKIVSDDLNFPTDIYVMKGMIEKHFKSHQLNVMESSDDLTIDTNTIRNHIDTDTALVSLSMVTYKSAFLYDVEFVNKLAKENGSSVIWDLSHAAGAIDINLRSRGCELAVGCTYKYLNGGPGSPAFLYVSREMQQKLNNPIWSWFGHNAPFDFSHDYKAHSGVQKFAIGTPSVLSMACIEPGIDLLLEAEMDKIRAKSIEQSEFLIQMIQSELESLGFLIVSPLDSKIRGSHVSISHKYAYQINRALIEPLSDNKIIIPDFRPPNNIRLGITPLYTSYMDIYECVVRLKEIVKTKEYERFGNERLTVT